MHSPCSANPPLRSPASPPRWRRSPSLPPPLPQQPAAIRPQAPAPAPPSAWSTRSSPARSAACTAAPTPGTSRSTRRASRSPASAPSTRPSRAASGSRGAPTASRSRASTWTAPTATCCRRPTVNADDATFRRNDVTNNHHSICFDLGHPDWGRADRHAHRAQPHPRLRPPARPPTTTTASTSRLASNTLIRGNWIYDNADYGIQLYPNAQNSRVVGNVIDGNGEGITFSGEYGVTSNGNIVEGNVIANSKVRNNVESWFPRGNPIGRGNIVRNNCIKGGVYDRGNGGIGDQWGFRVVEHDPHAGDLRGPCRARTSGSQRAVPAASGWPSPTAAPSPGPRACARPMPAERDDFPARDLRSGPPDRPPRPPPALHRPGRERAPGTARGALRPQPRPPPPAGQGRDPRQRNLRPAPARARAARGPLRARQSRGARSRTLAQHPPEAPPAARARGPGSLGRLTARRGIFLAPFDELAEPGLVAELAASAEARGWDGFFVWDHVAYREPVRALADPWVTLAAVATATERVRIGALVTPLPRRRPHQLARETVTLDRLSGGRLVLRRGDRQRAHGRVRPGALRRGGRSAQAGASCSTTASSACAPTGRASSSRARFSSRASRSGWPRAGRTGARCGAPPAGTGCSRSTCRGPRPWRSTPPRSRSCAGRSTATSWSVGNPAGTDPAPWEAAGATWCLTEFDLQPTEAEVREAIDEL